MKKVFILLGITCICTFSSVYAVETLNVGEVETRITSVQQDVPSSVPTVGTGYDRKGYVGSIIANIFTATQKIKSDFILAFRDIIGSNQNNIPKWNGNIFRPGTIYDVGGNIGIGTSSISTGLKLDVEGKVGATEYCDENGNNCTAAADIGTGGVMDLRFFSITGNSGDTDKTIDLGGNWSFCSMTGFKTSEDDSNNYDGCRVKKEGSMWRLQVLKHSSDTLQCRAACFRGNVGGGSSPWIENGSNVHRLSGDVGIRTSSPSAALHVVGVGRFDGGIQVDGNRAISNTNRSHTAQSNLSDYGFFQMKNAAGDTGAYIGAGNGGNRINFVLDTADRMNIRGGSVGIGVNDPGAQLHVNGNIIANNPIANNHVVTKSYVDNRMPIPPNCSGSDRSLGWTGAGWTCTTHTHTDPSHTHAVPSHTHTAPSYPTCYIAGTQVTMADGSKKNIEDVVIGEKVLGADGNINTVLGYDRPQLGSRLLYSFNGGPYFVTAEHPFRTVDGWKSIDVDAFIAENASLVEELQVTTLEVGDEIIMDDGTTTLITSIESRTEENQMLYNFNLDGDNVYFADGYMTHNKPGD